MNILSFPGLIMSHDMDVDMNSIYKLEVLTRHEYKQCGEKYAKQIFIRQTQWPSSEAPVQMIGITKRALMFSKSNIMQLLLNNRALYSHRW